jgi:hypothetical protein
LLLLVLVLMSSGEMVPGGGAPKSDVDADAMLPSEKSDMGKVCVEGEWCCEDEEEGR